ncbi:MAG: peroxide stress protein YaaA [Defluviitaleaceae bacterium]|nr:peroxide stress protein YaaA [Defluviitaleaceae bacterium]
MLKIIISPAKKMRYHDEGFEWEQLPLFLNQTAELKAHLAGLDEAALKHIWQCNDQIAALNYERLQKMSLTSQLTPAILAYEGIQYQYMAPHVFDEKQWDYVRQHLIILSGFYGLLRATDGVTPYRLEMQAKFPIHDVKNLYAYWKDSIYNALTKEGSVIVNLASKEYSKIVEKYVDDPVKMVTCTFGELVDVKGVQKVKTKATDAKMARGEMVRYMAAYQVKEVTQLKGFDRLNYVYSEAYSQDDNYVFLKDTHK